MVEYSADTWRSFVWLCFALAMFNVHLMVFLFPESNFERPGPHSPAQELQNYPEYKEDTVFVESTAESVLEEDTYSIRKPSFREILQLIRWNKEVNFFKALMSPLKLLGYPSLLWAILVYAICLSPQIIMMYESSLLHSHGYSFPV